MLLYFSLYEWIDFIYQTFETTKNKSLWKRKTWFLYSKMANFEAIRNQPLISEQGTVCQMHMLSLYCVFVMELEILQYTANFSHSSFLNWHFFFGKLQRQCYKNMIVLVFMSKHYPWILSKSKDFFASTYTTVTAACPIIEIFFSHAPQ